MNIRLATGKDRDAIWGILEPMIRAGETYTLPREMGTEEALAYWFSEEKETFVWEENGAILGTYFLKANQQGGGAHVANCGYVTAASAQGRGIARAMCLHSLQRAKERGFRALQFNFVVSTNERAAKLWQNLGFEIVGRLPGAFQHPRLGFVDALVMYRDLD
ncbi:MAG: GNAT family N-acetyltransferase [Candidatus Acidiferrum sp.]